MKTNKANQPKTGQPCHCKPGQQRDNCPDCEGTGKRIDFAAIRNHKTTPATPPVLTGSIGSYRTADGKAQIEWELTPKENGLEFSACGEFDGHAGQCLESIARAYPKDETVQRIVKVWREYHLNGMNSGTPEQTREVERCKLLAEAEARTWPDAEKYFYDAELREFNWNGYAEKFGKGKSFYDWACAVLKASNLYEIPLPAGLKATGGFPAEVVNGSRGYRYGARWVFRPIPSEIIAEIESWSKAPQPSEPLHEFKAKQFLAEHGLKLRATLSDSKPCPFGNGADHRHFRVTITRERTRGARLVFDCWGGGGQTEASAYDILSCVAFDVHTPETFEHFCAEYGEDSDSIKARQTFRRADKFARRLREFFTSEEIEALGDIR